MMTPKERTYYIQQLQRLLVILPSESYVLNWSSPDIYYVNRWIIHVTKDNALMRESLENANMLWRHFNRNIT